MSESDDALKEKIEGSYYKTHSLLLASYPQWALMQAVDRGDLATLERIHQCVKECTQELRTALDQSSQIDLVRTFMDSLGDTEEWIGEGFDMQVNQAVEVMGRSLSNKEEKIIADYRHLLMLMMRAQEIIATLP